MTRPTDAQLAALVRLWNTAQGDYGGARVCVKLLLGLYNGLRFPFDLTDLRLLDAQHLADALAVIEMDAAPLAEVHELLNRVLDRSDIGTLFELLACDWKFKGRCSKENEANCRAHLARLAEGKALVLRHLTAQISQLPSQLPAGAST